MQYHGMIARRPPAATVRTYGTNTPRRHQMKNVIATIALAPILLLPLAQPAQAAEHAGKGRSCQGEAKALIGEIVDIHDRSVRTIKDGHDFDLEVAISYVKSYEYPKDVEAKEIRRAVKDFEKGYKAQLETWHAWRDKGTASALEAMKSCKANGGTWVSPGIGL